VASFTTDGALDRDDIYAAVTAIGSMTVTAE
jgi:hypothetical protein